MLEEWTAEEEKKYEEAIAKFGSDPNVVSSAIGTKSSYQVKVRMGILVHKRNGKIALHPFVSK